MADIPNELEANISTTSIEVPQVDMIDSHETLQPGTSNSHAPHTRTIDAEIAGPSTSATGTYVAQSSYHTSDQVVGPPEMVYVSPGEIHSVPKAGPMKTKRSRKKGNTKILTSTPVRNEIALEKKKKKRKLSAPNVKKTLFQKDMSLIAEDSSEESEIEYAETSDEDGVSDDEIIEGDFVIVKVAGKSRVVNYIARIDVVGTYEYEGIFLHKVSGRLSAEGDDKIFVLNDDDEALFPADDIVQKLPQPRTVGGSARRSNQLKFHYNWNKRDLTK